MFQCSIKFSSIKYVWNFHSSWSFRFTSFEKLSHNAGILICSLIYSLWLFINHIHTHPFHTINECGWNVKMSTLFYRCHHCLQCLHPKTSREHTNNWMAWLAQWSIDQYPTGHGPVIFARMVTGNEKIFAPELEHEEISNSQITTRIGIPPYDTALP